MKKKIYLLSILFFGVSLFVSTIKAQPQISFLEDRYDFGTVIEENGRVSHVFEFTNTGDAALLIKHVRTSCGCTSPQWTRTPVEPGMKGSVKVTYNPSGRPYPFNKKITVYSNAKQESVILRIVGKVFTQSRLEEKYPLSIGDLRLKNKNLNFNVVKKGEKKSRDIEVFNNSSKTTTVVIENLPKGFFVVKNPTIVLKGKQKSKIKITFNSNKTEDWGTISEHIVLKINGVAYQQPNNLISLKAKVVEDFSNRTIEEKRNAPISQIKSSILNLGKIKQGKKVKEKIYIQNIGKNPLKIRKIENGTPNITVQSKTKTVKTGKKAKVIISVDTKNQPKGNYQRTFKVITNDPMNSNIIFKVKYQVI